MLDYNVYVENGYENRKDYLNSLADEYGVSKATVYSLASLLGKTEDFDGLICALNNIDEMEDDYDEDEEI